METITITISYLNDQYQHNSKDSLYFETELEDSLLPSFEQALTYAKANARIGTRFIKLSGNGYFQLHSVIL